MNKKISTLCYSLSGAICAGVLLLPTPVCAQTDDDSARVSLTTLHSFDVFDGKGPSGLVEGNDGYFYGTTAEGGTNFHGLYGYGSVFKISPDGTFTNLYTFTGENDGFTPYGGLVQGRDGYFYGTTTRGGFIAPYGGGNGTVFKISSTGEFTSVHTFTGIGNEGVEPLAGLTQGSDDYFYGTTIDGGSSGYYGTVFKISSLGELTTLYSFTGGIDGWFPFAGLTQGSDGYFYGTTANGGTKQKGTVFKVSSTGEFTGLHSFTGDDGLFPSTGLTQGSDGYFYGTTYTYGGGANDSQGTVFKISPDGTFTNLYFFTGGNDGGGPVGGLVQGSDGYFYGMTAAGGAGGTGTVFKISPDGTFASLYSFTGGNYGGNLGAALVEGRDGYFYGTTFGGGAGHAGTVFRLAVPLKHRFHEPHGRYDDPGKRVGP